MKTRLVDVGAEPTLELRWEFGDGWDGTVDVSADRVKGARVKPVLFLSESAAVGFDRHALRSKILGLGAVYCKVPTVNVARRKVTRDARHAAEVSLEESIRLFAEETSPVDAEEKVRFALALAREADAGAEA